MELNSNLQNFISHEHILQILCVITPICIKAHGCFICLVHQWFFHNYKHGFHYPMLAVRMHSGYHSSEVQRNDAQHLIAGNILHLLVQVSSYVRLSSCRLWGHIWYNITNCSSTNARSWNLQKIRQKTRPTAKRLNYYWQSTELFILKTSEEWYLLCMVSIGEKMPFFGWKILCKN